MRQALAAELLVAGEADPTALDQRLVGFLETLRRGDAAVGVALAALDDRRSGSAAGPLPRQTSPPPSAPPRRCRSARRRIRAHWRISHSRRRHSAGIMCRSPALCKSACCSSASWKRVAPDPPRARSALRFIYELYRSALQAGAARNQQVDMGEEPGTASLALPAPEKCGCYLENKEASNGVEGVRPPVPCWRR